MDPWIGENEAFVREICQKLDANESTFTKCQVHCPHRLSDEEWRVLANAVKRNTTIENLCIMTDLDSGVLSVSSTLSLASAALAHPKLKELEFSFAKFVEFNAIAVAIHEKKNLMRLKLNYCLLTPGVVENLSFLLKENALESLVLHESMADDVNRFLIDLGGAFGCNQSLKTLVISSEDYAEAAMSASAVEDIARLLDTNQGLKRLEVDFPGMDNRSDLMLPIVRSASGHASLENLSLYYSGGNDELEGHAAEAVADMMTATPTLRELVLANCGMGDEGAILLVQGLSSEICSLKKLNLSENRIGDIGASALAAALRENSSVEELDLCNNEIGSTGAAALASTLTVTTSLKEVRIESNEIGDGAILIAQALRCNRTLERLAMDCSDKESLESVSSCLPSMSGLMRLSLYHVEEITSEMGSAILKAIKRNTTLEYFNILTTAGTDQTLADIMRTDQTLAKIMPQVDRLLALNRGGRRILGSESEVPCSLWPRILAKSSNTDANVVYFFLREKPDVFFKRTTVLGKRKRSHSSCIIS